MISSTQVASSACAVDVLVRFHRKGVQLWAEQGRLRYRVAKGALDREDLETLSRHKGEILALLTQTRPHSLTIKPRAQVELVPLTYSQLSHWHRYHLAERPHLRQLACATRLSGPLAMGALRESLEALFRRHEALRARIVVVDQIPMQRIEASGGYELALIDLSARSDDVSEHEIKQHVESFAGEAVDVCVGPLFAARLLRLAENEHVLIVTMEHMISDGVSLNILMRDLFATYEHMVRGTHIELPALPVQFPDYAVWQRDAEQSWIEQYAQHVSQRLAARPCVRFPSDIANASGRSGWAMAPIRIDRQLQDKLRHWCRGMGVTLPMSVFAAYAALVLRWCRLSEMAVRYVTDGRITPALENAIGYFAYLMYLRVSLREEDTPLDLIRRVTEEYCSAQECPHLGYIEAQPSLPEFARGFGFNWVPQGGHATQLEPAADALQPSLTRTPVPFEHPILRNFEQDLQPFALFYDTADGIVGGVHYPQARISKEAMETFSHCLVEFVEAFIGRPDARVASIPLSP